MTRIEYDLLREQEPQLGLLDWNALTEDDKTRLVPHSRETLIIATTMLILKIGRKSPWPIEELV